MNFSEQITNKVNSRSDGTFSKNNGTLIDFFIKKKILTKEQIEKIDKTELQKILENNLTRLANEKRESIKLKNKISFGVRHSTKILILIFILLIIGTIITASAFI